MRNFFARLIRAAEKSGQRRAELELRRMGYTPERLAKMTNENLERWV